MTDMNLGAITAGEETAFPQVAESLSPASNIGRPAWARELKHRLEQLLDLKTNWDGRGSAAVSPDAVSFAFAVLHRVMPPNAPAPSVHALGHGGLQLSWTSAVADLDLEVIAPNNLLVCYAEKPVGADQEWTATNELSRLERVLWQHFKG